MAIHTVQVRIVAESEAVARSAIQALRNGLGSTRVAMPPPSPGRRGQYLAYGTLQFDDDADTLVQHPAASPAGPPPSPAATGPMERLPVTGPTERLPTTGPTTRLPRRRNAGGRS